MKNFILLSVLVASVHAFGCEVSSSNLQEQNSIYCENESGAKTFDFAYSAEKNQELMISWEAEGCGGKAAKTVEKYELLTYDANGNLEWTETVEGSFSVKEGKKHALRVHLSDVASCPYYSLDFGVQSF